MLGDEITAGSMFSYAPLERQVPGSPLRPLRAMVDAALTSLSPQLDRLHARTGRPSIPPERLLAGDVAQASDDDDPGNPTFSFRAEKRSKATHESAIGYAERDAAAG
jgi:hypothetical protein